MLPTCRQTGTQSEYRNLNKSRPLEAQISVATATLVLFPITKIKSTISILFSKLRREFPRFDNKLLDKDIKKLQKEVTGLLCFANKCSRARAFESVRVGFARAPAQHLIVIYSPQVEDGFRKETSRFVLRLLRSTRDE